MDSIPFIGGILRELSSVFVTEWQSLLPFFGAVFLLHVVSQYILPLLFTPAVYDFLIVKEKAKNPSVSNLAELRRTAAIDARSKVVATAFATYVTIGSLWGLVEDFKNGGVLQNDPYAFTPLSDHLMRCAAAYFVWDIVVCFIDGYDFTWWIHAVCCLAVFTAALHPFLHYMGMISLLFEASTPFLHIRKTLIQADQTKGKFFQFIQIGFALCFFLVRIVFGYYKCYGPNQWNTQMNELLENGKPHEPQIVYLYKFNCFVLSALNAYWMYAILASATKGEKKKETGGTTNMNVENKNDLKKE